MVLLVFQPLDQEGQQEAHLQLVAAVVVQELHTLWVEENDEQRERVCV